MDDDLIQSKYEYDLLYEQNYQLYLEHKEFDIHNVFEDIISIYRNQFSDIYDKVIPDFIKHGIDINNERVYYGPECFLSPLQYACTTANYKLIDSLLKNGANINDNILEILLEYYPEYGGYDENIYRNINIFKVEECIKILLKYGMHYTIKKDLYNNKLLIDTYSKKSDYITDFFKLCNVI